MPPVLSVEERDEATRRRRLNLLCLALGVMTAAGLFAYPFVLFVFSAAD